MAYTINTEYDLSVGVDDRITVAQTIRAAQLLNASQNVGFLYARWGRRVIGNHYNNDRVVTNTSYASYVRWHYTPNTDMAQTTVTIHAVGQNIDVQVSIVDGSGVLDSASTTIGGGGGFSSVTVDPSGGSGYLYIDVEVRRNGAGTFFFLGAMAVEDPLGASDTYTGFAQIDDTAYDADENLAALLGVRLAESISLCSTVRTRAISQGWDRTDPAVMHGFPRGDVDAGERGVIPYLLPHEPFETGLTLTVRCSEESAGSEDVRIGVALGELRRTARVGSNLSTTTVAGGAAVANVSPSEVDCTAFASTQLVFATFDSDSNSVLAYTANGSVPGVGNTVALGFDTVGGTDLHLGTSATVDDTGTWTAIGGWADEVRPQWMQWQQQSGTLEGWPAPFWCLRTVVGDGSADGQAYMFRGLRAASPSLSSAEAGGNLTGVYLYRYLAGYLHVDSIGWEYTSATALDDLRDQFEAGRPTSALTAKSLQTLPDRLWGQRGRIYWCGPPTPAYETTDPDSAFTAAGDASAPGTGTVSSVGRPVAMDTDTWTTIAPCVVGDVDSFRVNGGSTSDRTRFTVDALVLCWGYLWDGRDRDYEYRYQFRVVAGATTTDAITTDIDPHWIDMGRYTDDPVGWYFGWFGTAASDPSFSRNPTLVEIGRTAGRGLIPEDLWPLMRYKRVTIDVQCATGLNSQATTLRLQANLNPVLAGRHGDAGTTSPHIEVLTWTVYETPYSRTDDINDYGHNL